MVVPLLGMAARRRPEGCSFHWPVNDPEIDCFDWLWPIHGSGPQGFHPCILPVAIATTHWLEDPRSFLVWAALNSDSIMQSAANGELAILALSAWLAGRFLFFWFSFRARYCLFYGHPSFKQPENYYSHPNSLDYPWWDLGFMKRSAYRAGNCNGSIGRCGYSLYFRQNVWEFCLPLVAMVSEWV